MKKYFYTLHVFRTPNHISNVLNYVRDKQIGTLDDSEAYDLLMTIENIAIRDTNQYKLSNNQDIRGFTKYGYQEVSEEGYNRIVEDEKLILNNLTDKDKELFKQFGHELCWHSPFEVEGNSENEIYQIVQSYNPNYRLLKLKINETS